MKISVITATYNSAATLRDTIESLLAQTHSDWEHVIVDGASSDNTLAIVEEYRTAYAGRLRLISEPDRGIYDAMNKGIALATGQAVGILNSDDLYSYPFILSQINENLNNSEAVYGDIHFVDAEDLTRCVRYYSSRRFRPWHMFFGFMPAHPSFYCLKKVYEKHGCFDLDFKVAADFENLLRIIYLGRTKTKYLPLDFVTMRTGGASTSGFQSHKIIFKDHLKAYRKHRIHSGIIPEAIRYSIKTVDILSQKISKSHCK